MKPLVDPETRKALRDAFDRMLDTSLEEHERELARRDFARLMAAGPAPEDFAKKAANDFD